MLLSGMRGKNYGVEHLLAPFSGGLDHILDATLGLTSERVDFLFTIGALYLSNKRISDRNIQIESQSYLRVHTHPRRFPSEIFDLKKCLIEETEDYIVINKPSGLPVHPTVDNQIENVANLISNEIKHEIHVTHRLDVGTSGLLILAKNKKFQSEMNQIFMQSSQKLLTTDLSAQQKPLTTESIALDLHIDENLKSNLTIKKTESIYQFEKKYRALVYDSPALQDLLQSQQELVHFMEPSPRAPKNVSRESIRDWQICRLKILSANKIKTTLPDNKNNNLKSLQNIESSKQALNEKTDTLTDPCISEQKNKSTNITSDNHHDELIELEIELLTGRTHQIRAQLADIGSPVVGDEMYGAPTSNKNALKTVESFCLQSQSLSWYHPKYGEKKFSLTKAPW